MKLTNQDVVGAVNALAAIRDEKLPVKVSMDLAQMAIKLGDTFKAFEEVREGLRKTYEISSEVVDDKVVLKSKLDEGAKKGEEGKQVQKFLDEMRDLLKLEVEVVVKVVALPEKVAGTCDKCGHNMDVPLQLTQGTMVALAKLVTV